MSWTKPLIAVDGIVLGYREGRRWVSVDDRFAKGKTGLRFVPVTLGKIGAAYGPVKLVGNEHERGCYIDSPRAKGNVSVLGLKPTVPRKVEVLGSSAVYERVAQRFLRDVGYADVRVRVKRVVVADLDGDGTQEAIVEARSRDDLDKPQMERQCSVVILRCLRNGKERLVKLELSGGAPLDTELDRVMAVADLDGDGRMEVVTSGRGYEWGHGTVWTYRDSVVREVVSGGYTL